MSDIKPISADSSDESDVYRLLVITHRMAGALACEKKENWQLARTATHEHYVLTVWTNGIVDIGAETEKGCGGEPLRHRYWLAKARDK